jgi:hypothetical protein
MAKRLKRISKDMLKIGADMEYYGGFGEIGAYGREMIKAGTILLQISTCFSDKSVTKRRHLLTSA